jgi:uncharacterized protein YaaN involved in tellurite resistance
MESSIADKAEVMSDEGEVDASVPVEVEEVPQVAANETDVEETADEKTADADVSVASPQGGDEEEEKDQSDNKTDTIQDWSEVLKSPNDVETFSPSIDISKPGSLHGLGRISLSLVVEKVHQRHQNLMIDSLTFL